MRMTPEALHTWSQRLQLSSETEALIASIRSSPLVRRVSGRAENITGRSPSPRLQCTIQFESEHVEFCAFTEVIEVMSSQMQEDDDLPQTVCQSIIDVRKKCVLTAHLLLVKETALVCPH